MSKKLVTKKQQAILTLIYTFRFINSKQIQAFLGHKDHRRINAWLKDLVEKEYVERDFTPVFGTLTKPAVYSLSIKGRAHIRNTYDNISRKYLERLRDDKNRSKSFRVRCQVLADSFFLLFPERIAALLDAIEEILDEGVTLRYNQPQFFTSAFYEDLDFVLLTGLKPDAYLYRRTKQGINHHCMYILDAYVPRLMLNYLLKRIFSVLDEEYWEEEHVASLQLYFVCPNNQVIIYLRRLLPSFLENYYGKTLIAHFATRNQIYKRRNDKTVPTGWIKISSTDH